MTKLNKKNIDRKYYSNIHLSVNSEKNKGENILIFQTDTCLCSKGSKDLINM